MGAFQPSHSSSQDSSPSVGVLRLGVVCSSKGTSHSSHCCSQSTGMLSPFGECSSSGTFHSSHGCSLVASK